MTVDLERVRKALKRLDEIAIEHPELIGNPGESSVESWVETLEVSMKDVFTIKEAAEFFSVHPETIRRAIRKGTLKAGKLGKDYRISKADLIEYYNRTGGGSLVEMPGIID